MGVTVIYLALLITEDLRCLHSFIITYTGVIDILLALSLPTSLTIVVGYLPLIRIVALNDTYFKHTHPLLLCVVTFPSKDSP